MEWLLGHLEDENINDPLAPPASAAAAAGGAAPPAGERGIGMVAAQVHRGHTRHTSGTEEVTLLNTNQSDLFVYLGDSCMFPLNQALLSSGNPHVSG
jgi:hypothetical protein